MNFKDTVIKSYPTGSRYICDPAPTDTDNDTVFLVNGFYDYATLLREEGFDSQLSELQYNTMGEFTSFRKGTENYIVTENPEFYNDYVKATEGAKALNLLKKEDRIKLFQAIMAGYEKVIPAVDPVVPAQIDFDFNIANVNAAAERMLAPFRVIAQEAFNEIWNGDRPVRVLA